jgi:maleylacetoacetate isomerase
MSVTLYGFWRSLAAYRVRAALNYKGIPFTEKIINLVEGDQFSEDYHKLNPQHVIPLLEHGGRKITQSLAILEYIEQMWPNRPTLPKDAYEQAYVRSISLITIADTHPLVVPRIRGFLHKTYGQDEAGQAAWAQHWFNEGSLAIEARLHDEGLFGQFTLGDQVSIADFSLCSHVIGARLFGADTSLAPQLVKIADHCLSLDAFAKAHPMKQPGAPIKK